VQGIALGQDRIDPSPGRRRKALRVAIPAQVDISG